MCVIQSGYPFDQRVELTNHLQPEEPEYRGRRQEKGKAKVRVEGFDAIGQVDDTDKDQYVDLRSDFCWLRANQRSDMVMDWRTGSRSRSRVSAMDWKPTSRSRSRVPGQDPFSEAHAHALLEQNFAGYMGHSSRDLVPFPASDHEGGSSKLAASPPIPIPGSGSGSGSRSSLTSYENTIIGSPDGSEFTHGYGGYGLGQAHHAASLPAFGMYSLPARATGIPSETHAFPRRVRKTSFDHTVNSSGGIGIGSGRHQVNGRPLAPETDSTLVCAGVNALI